MPNPADTALLQQQLGAQTTQTTQAATQETTQAQQQATQQVTVPSASTQETPKVENPLPGETPTPPVSPPSQAETPPQAVTAETLGYEANAVKDPAIGAIIGLFVEKGIKAEQFDTAIADAVNTMDASKINEAAIRTMVGDKADLVITSLKGVFHTKIAEYQETARQVQASVGGEQNWKQILDWAHTKEAADAGFKQQMADYRKLAGKDRQSAVLVAQALKGMYTGSSTATRKPVSLVSGDSGGYGGSAPPILDKAEFGKLMAAELKKSNGAMTQEAQVILARWRMGGGRT